MRPIACLSLLFCFASLSSALDFEPRTWTNDEGKTITAPLVGLSRSTVFLDQDGKRVPARISRLSEADQQYVEAARQLRKRRDWTMPDGSTQTGSLESVEEQSVKIKGREEFFELRFDQLTAEERVMLKVVFPKLDLGEVEVLTPGDEAGKIRTWTDASGKTIEAELRGVEGDNVVLYFKDREWRVPLARFSQEDRDFVAQALSANEQAVAEAAATPPADTERRRPPGGQLAESAPVEEAPPSPMLPPDAGQPPQAEEMPQTVRGRAEEMRLEAERRQQEMIARIGPAAEQVQQPQEAATPDAQPQPDSEGLAATQQMDAASDDESPPAADDFAALENSEELEEYFCLSCGHEWESAQDLGLADTCPNCGTRFADMEFKDDGSSRSSYRKYRWIIRLSIFVVISILGAIGKAMFKG